MKKLVHFITHSKAAAYIAALLYVVVWGFRSVQGGGFDLSGCLGVLLALMAGYLSVRVTRELSLGDGKHVLSATLFFMGCAVAPQLNLASAEGVHFMLFSVACYVLLHTHRIRNAMGGYFLAFLFIGIQCLMTPTLLLALPALVLCGAFVDSLHARTLLAALWGLLCPFWVVGSVLFLMDKTALIAPYFGQIWPAMSSVPAVWGSCRLWMPVVWMLLLAVPGSVVILLNRTMKLQTSARLRFVIFSLVVLLVTACLSLGCYTALMPSVLMAASLIGAALFVGEDSRACNIYLLVLVILWLVALGLQIWRNSIMY